MGISYEDIWEKIIWNVVGRFSIIKDLTLRNEEKIKKEIKNNFDDFCNKCKENYMNPNSVKNLDRHKIAACLMYAIIKTKMYESYPASDSDSNVIIVTEQIAITVGLSVLRTYLVNEYAAKCQRKDQAVWDEDKAIFGEGFILPGESGVNDVYHGEYRNNFAMELHFTKIENTYNILSLSNSLYLLEMYNRHFWKIHNR